MRRPAAFACAVAECDWLASSLGQKGNCEEKEEKDKSLESDCWKKKRKESNETTMEMRSSRRRKRMRNQRR